MAWASHADQEIKPPWVIKEGFPKILKFTDIFVNALG